MLKYTANLLATDMSPIHEEVRFDITENIPYQHLTGPRMEEVGIQRKLSVSVGVPTAWEL